MPGTTSLHGVNPHSGITVDRLCPQGRMDGQTDRQTPCVEAVGDYVPHSCETGVLRAQKGKYQGLINILHFQYNIGPEYSLLSNKKRLGMVLSSIYL